MSLWTEDFFPKVAEEFVGNQDIVEKSIGWAKQWNEGIVMPPLLLWGQTGSGKTALAYMIAKMFGWNVVELNSSDLRSKDNIEKVVGAASQNASFFGARRLILIDEVDALTREDRGGAGAIGSVIKGTKNPVILTATDIFENKSVSSLRFVCKTFEFRKINYLSMAKKLGQILSSKKLGYDAEAINELAKNSSGDMRSALLDLQTLSLAGKVTMEDVKSLSVRERQQKVFNVMKSIFKGTDFAEVRSARMKSDLDNDMLFMWIDENIPRQYSARGDIALAFDRLSRADIFNGRIYRRQHWGFLRYSTELAAEGVALSKDKVSHDFVMYQFPGLLSMLSKTSGIRAVKKSIGQKIGKLTHSSSRKVISSDLPYLKMVFEDKEKAIALTATFELEEKELALLLGTTPDTKKVKSILELVLAMNSEDAKPKALPQSFYGNKEEEQIQQEPSEEPGKGKQTKLF